MEEAKQLFKKLKIHTLLDLALIIPTSYNDTTLSTTLELGKINTLEAKWLILVSIRGNFVSLLTSLNQADDSLLLFLG